MRLTLFIGILIVATICSAGEKHQRDKSEGDHDKSEHKNENSDHKNGDHDHQKSEGAPDTTRRNAKRPTLLSRCRKDAANLCSSSQDILWCLYEYRDHLVDMPCKQFIRGFGSCYIDSRDHCPSDVSARGCVNGVDRSFFSDDCKQSEFFKSLPGVGRGFDQKPHSETRKERRDRYMKKREEMLKKRRDAENHPHKDSK